MSNPPIQAIAAKAKFEAARAALEAFNNENAKLIEERALLVAAYNDALAAVKTEYKKSHTEIGKTWGEFKAVPKVEVDAARLLKLMPNAEGLVRIEYKIIAEEWKKAIGAGLIPDEVQSQVVMEGTPAIYGPKEA